MNDEIMFREMQAALAAARAAHPDRLHEASYVFAGFGVRMRVVGERLASYLHLPFAHLQSDAVRQPPLRLTIDLWDGSATEISPPLDRDVDGEVWESGSSRSQDGRFFTNFTHTSVSCFDRSQRHIVGYARDAQRLSLYERGRPLHVPLTIWHNDRNVPLIHAGMVARDGHGVLLAGASGSGKSTSAIACLCAGQGFLSDDMIGLQSLSDGAFVGHSVYGSTFMEADDVRQFAVLVPHALSRRYSFQDKQLVLLSQAFPGRLECSAPIKAVALATVAGRRQTRIRPASKAEALLALAPSSIIIGIITSGRCGFDKLARLVDRVPSYWLELGHDRNEIPERIAELATAGVS